MKRIIFILFAQFALLATVDAQSVDGVKVENLRMKRNGGFMVVNMDVDFSSLKVSSNRAVLFTPVIVNDKDSVLSRKMERAIVLRRSRRQWTTM